MNTVNINNSTDTISLFVDLSKIRNKDIRAEILANINPLYIVNQTYLYDSNILMINYTGGGIPNLSGIQNDKQLAIYKIHSGIFGRTRTKTFIKYLKSPQLLQNRIILQKHIDNDGQRRTPTNKRKKVD